MVDARPFLVYDAPLAIGEPPVDAVYQSMVQPLGAVAENTALLVPQYALVLGLLGATGTGFIVQVTAVRVALTQPVVVLRDSA